MNEALKALIISLRLLYIISPIADGLGSIDDLIVLFIGAATRKQFDLKNKEVLYETCI